MKKTAAALVAFGLATTGLAVGMPTAAAAEPVQGRVFVDYGGDGAFTATGAVQDSLLGGVTVTAYNAGGAAVASTTTTPALDGASNYTLDLTAVALGTPLRIEFTGLPDGLYDSFASASGQSGSVQFTTAGAAATSIDYGVLDPSNYVPATGYDINATPLFTAVQWAGLNTGTPANQAAIVGTPWVVTENTGTSFPGRVTFATYGQVGSVWGLAFDGVGRDLYAAASYKRLSALGSLGLGGIYRVNDVQSTSGQLATAGSSVTPWVDVSTIGINVGSVPSNSARGLSTPATLARDADGFANSAKVGIGGISVTDDGKHLIVVNLYDSNLYVIDIPSNGAAPTAANVRKVDFKAGAGLSDGQRPWAIAIHQGAVYVGYVDTGSTPGQSAKSAALKAYVAKADLSDVLDGGGSWSNALTADLGYKKGNSVSNWGGTGANSLNWGTTTQMQVTRWNTWTDTWSWGANTGTYMSDPGATNVDTGVATSVGLARTSGNWTPTASTSNPAVVQIYPQAILSGLTFDRDGFLTLGFSDRTSLQSGNRNLAAHNGSQTGPLFETLASGDVLIAAPQANGTFALEDNGVVTGASGTRTTSYTHSSNTQGPPGASSREFYNDNQNKSTVGGGNHLDNALGAVVAYPGLNQVAATAYDPLSTIRVSGVSWFNATNGANLRGYDHNTNDDRDNGSTGFQKGGGMGDLVLALKAAPVEIGNRTWLDLDGDGVQDAGEPSIAGAKVTLYKADTDGNPTGAAIDTKTTDANGNYFFRSQDAGSGGSEGFTREGDYVVVFEPGSGNVTLNWHGAAAPEDFPTLTWNQLGLTDQSANAQDAQRDSNANPANGYAPVTVGTAGQNDHSIDAGWRLGSVSVGDRVWIDSNKDGLQDKDDEGNYTEPGLPGVTLKILGPDGAPARDIFGNPVPDETTDDDGIYSFTNLPILAPEESYTVVIVTTPAGYEPTQVLDDGTGADDSSLGSAESQIPLTTNGANDPTLDFGFIKVAPEAVILKGDGTNPDAVIPADTAADAVDLTVPGENAGSTTLLFEVTNTGSEDLYDVVVTDQVTVGSAKVENLVCTFPGDDAPTDGQFDEGKWTVTWTASLETAGDDRVAFEQGGTFTCSADLTGVIGDHANVATITGVGANSGEPVPVKPFDPENPDEPGTDNPFHAKRTPAVSVGDRVWFDADGDGQQGRDDQGYTEPGIDGVVLKLVGPDGNRVTDVFGDEVGPQTTENGGKYLFPDLPVLQQDQSYRVVIDQEASAEALAPYTPTTQGDNNGSGEFDSSTDETSSVASLTDHGAKDLTLDFGFIKKEPTADIEKSDKPTGNTADDGGTPVDVGPTGGTTTVLFTITNPLSAAEPLTNIGLDDVTTAGTGAIQYPIVCTPPQGDEFDLVDKDARWDGELAVGATITCEAQLTGVEPGTDHRDLVTLHVEGKLSGEPVLVPDPDNPEGPKVPPSNEFNAKYKTYAIGDYVWVETAADTNGVQGDASDVTFAAGTQVRLWKLDAEGNRTGTATTVTTNADGRYLFDELTAGDYEVEFKLPSGYVWVPAGAGADDAADSDATHTAEDQEWASTGKITLGSGSTLVPAGDYDGIEVQASEGVDPTWDAGIVRLLPGGTILKDDSLGNAADTADDAVDVGPSGGEATIVFTIENTGGEPLTNISLVDATTAGSGSVSYPFACEVDGAAPAVEFSLTQENPAWGGVLPVGGKITCEASLAGVEPGQSHADEVTLNAEGALTGDPVLDPETEEPPTNEYHAKYKTYAIGDVVWIDGNANGVQGDEGDVPFADGLTVNLWKVDGEGNRVGQLDDEGDPVTDGEGNPLPFATTVTDADGLYLFDELTAGGYLVEYVLPDGYRWTPSTVTIEGADATNDSNAVFGANDDPVAASAKFVLGDDSVTTDYSAQEFTASEGIDPTWDAGLIRKTYAIGDVVWVDRNQNGQQDDSELPLGEVTVNLYKAGADGKPSGDPIATDTTDGNGRYLFDELSAGEYVVEFVLPDGYTFTTQDAAGVLDGKDSDADTTTGLTEKITLGNASVTNEYTDQSVKATEGVDPTWDAGVVPQSVSVGDFVWVDLNGDGTQDDGEPGIPEVELTITGPNGPVTDVYGAPVGPATTDENGKYSFKDLPVLKEGEEYIVTIGSVDDKYKPTLQGADNGSGADDSSTGSATSVLDLTKDGSEDPTLDFGFVLKTPGGDVVKADEAGNDANDASEAVDLGPSGGTTTIEFTIENNGDEPITQIGLADVSTGSGSVSYPFACTADEVEFSLDSAEARWDGSLAVGKTIVCTATLSGVKAGEPHANLVTLHAEGALTGKPVLDPTTGQPPTDPYNSVVKTYALGDVVWVDRDQDGQQDDGEPVLSDVTVNLYQNGEKVASDSTDGQGRYLFDDLPAGDYVVEFVLPDGYKFTTKDAAGVPDSADSDADVATGRTVSITLGDSNEALTKDYPDQSFTATEGVDPTWDAGVIPESVAVGDYVWFDLDGDGKQDDGEPGIGGVTLTIEGPEGPVTNVYGEKVGPATTKPDGSYWFADLPVLKDGQAYTVTISGVPAKFKPTKAGENNGSGADDSSTGTSTSQVPLTKDGAEDPTLDFGFVLKDPGAVVVKADEAGNDANDSAAPVDLSSQDGSTTIVFTIVNNGDEPITNIGLADKTTAGSGTVSYPLACVAGEAKFSLADADAKWDGELGIGEQIACEGVLSGVKAHEPHTDVVTLWADGTLTGKPVVDPNNPGTPEEPNRPTDPYNSVVKTYAIGDYVWVDQIKPNGVQDGEEPGLGGVKVVLLDEDGDEIARTETSGSGYYQFDNLKPGVYQVQFDLPFGYVFIAADQGDDDAADSDALVGDDASSGRTIKVTLDDTNDRLTSRDGVNATEGIDPTWDAGVRLAEVSVGDYVWKDVDRDGLQDEGEPGIPGVVLEITRSDGEPVIDVDGNPVGPVTTDGDGGYTFDKLPLLLEGVDYVVSVDKEASKEALGTLIPTVPGAGEDRGTDSSTWEETATGLVKDGDSDPSLDFGFVEPKVSVGDRVWEDSNKDGIQDPGEPGIPGVVLVVVGPDGEPVTDVFGNPVEPVTTDEHGNYVFENLPVLPEGESYKVIIDREASEEALKPFEPTIEGAGNDPARDSSTWEAESGDLTEDGASDPTLDFGFKRPSVTIGDKVWKDIDRDGRQDAGEPGIPGVVLVVVGPDGKPVTDVFGKPVGSVTTDAAGNYVFENLPVLPEGKSYTVVIDREQSKEALGNLIPTIPGQGDRAGDSSDWEAKSEGLTKDLDKDLTLDFGFVVPKVSVGDKVWIDSNGNGRQDSGEPGVPGVVLKVLDPDGKPVTDVFGNPVPPVSTDKDGKYLFENLPALPDGKSYRVVIDREASADALKGYKPTTAGVGDREGDSSSWEATTLGLNSDGEQDLTLDFGFVPIDVVVPDKPSPGLPSNGFGAQPLLLAGILMTLAGAALGWRATRAVGRRAS